MRCQSDPEPDSAPNSTPDGMAASARKADEIRAKHARPSAASAEDLEEAEAVSGWGRADDGGSATASPGDACAVAEPTPSSCTRLY